MAYNGMYEQYWQNVVFDVALNFSVWSGTINPQMPVTQAVAASVIE